MLLLLSEDFRYPNLFQRLKHTQYDIWLELTAFVCGNVSS